MQNNYKNLGVKLGTRASDYVGGTIPYEIRNPSGDWTPYLPVGEIQRGKEDWMDCTIRSGTNVIEIQEKQQTGVESNYNDREVAIGAGVTRQGAYLWQGAEYIRTTGLAQQATWPDSNGTFDEQYTPPSPEIRAQLDKEKADWLTKWSILHEDIPYDKDSLLYHLKHAPIQVVIPGHAIAEIAILSPSDVNKIMDSYPPYVKNIPGEYPGPLIFAKKIVLYKKEQALDPDTLLVDIKFGDHGPQVLKLKRALKRLGWVLDGVEAQDGWDMYNDKIAELVFNFQLANLDRRTWSFWWAFFYYRGRLVDSVTREIINNDLKNRK